MMNFQKNFRNTVFEKTNHSIYIYNKKSSGLHKKIISLSILILLVPSTILFTSCSKKTKYTLSGTLYNDCGEPVTNSSIDIRQRSTAYSDYSGGSIDVVKTDGSGKFSLKYKSLDNGGTPISIFDGSGADAKLLMSNIPANTDLSVDIYRQKTVKINFIINYSSVAASLYSKKDTLYIGGNKFGGPFSKGQVLGPISEQQDVNFYNFQTKDYTVCYGVNFNDYINSIITLGHYKEYQIAHYNMGDCGSDTNVSIFIK